MKSKAVTIIVGMMMSMGMLFVGFFALDRVAKKEETVKVQGNVPKEDDELPVVEQPEKVEQLETLPNAENEVAKWNATASEFIERYPEFRFDASRIVKDEMKSNDEVTTFSHEFNTAVKISLVYTVNNETEEIIEMRLICHDTGPDSAAIFHTMSMFISYVDDEIPTDRAGEFLGDNTFTIRESGIYELELNGKKYEYLSDMDQFIRTLVYRVES
ncbi:hypothetical protein MHH33_14265 [Paenisporosarcina sp. FSL H8-0542]|uniref:hypothetical protein n=1 Tax=Paenisporosarcina sp. FSL H8-0542 TaxID=2921401 RepID=UPI00315AA432